MEALLETWRFEESLVVATLTVTAFILLYAVAVIHRNLRLIESRLDEMQKDQSVMSDELEIVASTGHENGKV
jgi:hypothetical protein